MKRVLFLLARTIYNKIKSQYHTRFVACFVCFLGILNHAQAQNNLLTVYVPNKYECYIGGGNEIDLLVYIEGIEPFSTKTKKYFWRKQLIGKIVKLEYKESTYKAKKAKLKQNLENALKQLMSAEEAMKKTKEWVATRERDTELKTVIKKTTRRDAYGEYTTYEETTEDPFWGELFLDMGALATKRRIVNQAKNTVKRVTQDYNLNEDLYKASKGGKSMYSKDFEPFDITPLLNTGNYRQGLMSGFNVGFDITAIKTRLSENFLNHGYFVDGSLSLSLSVSPEWRWSAKNIGMLSKFHAEIIQEWRSFGLPKGESYLLGGQHFQEPTQSSFELLAPDRTQLQVSQLLAGLYIRTQIKNTVFFDIGGGLAVLRNGNFIFEKGNTDNPTQHFEAGAELKDRKIKQVIDFGGNLEERLYGRIKIGVYLGEEKRNGRSNKGGEIFISAELLNWQPYLNNSLALQRITTENGQLVPKQVSLGTGELSLGKPRLISFAIGVAYGL